MTVIPENEQLDNDFNVFAVDKRGSIALLCHVGWRLLPPSVAISKENLELVERFLLVSNIFETGFRSCQDLKHFLHSRPDIDPLPYTAYFGEISKKGLYTYDSYDGNSLVRPYYRVTVPKVELKMDQLPDEIRTIMSKWQLLELSFADCALIPEEVVRLM